MATLGSVNEISDRNNFHVVDSKRGGYWRIRTLNRRPRVRIKPTQHHPRNAVGFRRELHPPEGRDLARCSLHTTMIWSEIDRVHRLRKWPWVTLPRRYLTFWTPRDAIAPYTVLVRVTSTTIMCFSRTHTQPQYLAQTGMVCSTASLAPFLFRPYYYISGTCCIMYTAPKIGML